MNSRFLPLKEFVKKTRLMKLVRNKRKLCIVEIDNFCKYYCITVLTEKSYGMLCKSCTSDQNFTKQLNNSVYTTSKRVNLKKCLNMASAKESPPSSLYCHCWWMQVSVNEHCFVTNDLMETNAIISSNYTLSQKTRHLIFDQNSNKCRTNFYSLPYTATSTLNITPLCFKSRNILQAGSISKAYHKVTMCQYVSYVSTSKKKC